jgi:hypothetical protein
MFLVNWINRITAYMASLVSDGGPSATRWVFLRTAEAITLGWLGMVAVLCIRYIHTGNTDAALITAIITVMGALFGFASLNQNTKLAIDAKLPGSPSTLSTPGASVTSGGDSPKS